MIGTGENRAMPNNIEHVLETLFDYQHIAQNNNLELAIEEAEASRQCWLLSLEELEQVAGGQTTEDPNAGLDTFLGFMSEMDESSNSDPVL